jgi:hypothetical protein
MPEGRPGICDGSINAVPGVEPDASFWILSPNNDTQNSGRETCIKMAMIKTSCTVSLMIFTEGFRNLCRGPNCRGCIAGVFIIYIFSIFVALQVHTIEESGSY